MRQYSLLRLTSIVGVATGGAVLFVLGATHVGQWLSSSLGWMDKAALVAIGVGVIMVMCDTQNDGGSGDWLGSDSGGGDGGGGD